MKRTIALLIVFATLLLSGCSTVDAKLEQVLLEKSGIFEHDDYIQYKQFQVDGMLNEHGQYTDPILMQEAVVEETKPGGKIHVTFAENRYLDIGYYLDSTMETPIDTTMCYLNPGDAFYAKVVGCLNPNSNLYRLSEYRILEYDIEGNIKKEQTQKANGDVFVYTIPKNFSGNEIAIIPVGEYPDRNLSMEVYYIDDSGNEHLLRNAGTWTINNTDINGNTAQISPIESYVLKFTFDNKNYFYVDCEPECFTKDPEASGWVEFWEAEPTDADMSYRIELHQFLRLSLQFDKDAQVIVNNGSPEVVKKGKVWNPGKLQYGDIITIETPGDCTIIDGDYKHISASKDPIMNGYRYTLSVVPEAENNSADLLKKTVDVKRIFAVTLDTRCNYGTCVYKLDGKEVSGEIQVQEGQELTLTYKITNDKYSFAEKSEGFGGFIHDLFKSSERSISIPITAELDGTTIIPDDWVNIIEKGE